MAKSEFTETQFVFGFLKELWERDSGVLRYSPNFMFPSQNMERFLPVDFFIDYYSHSEYYQFKRSHCYSQRRGANEIRSGLPTPYWPYYCFGVYNRTTASALGQFDKLKELARLSPGDLVCYSAPCFHTENEFLFHFYGGTVMANSVIIECNQFNDARFNPPSFDINNGNHNLVFQPGNTTAYLCSELLEIATTKYDSWQSSNNEEEGNSIRFREYLNTIYSQVYMKDELSVKVPKNELIDRTQQRIIALQDYLFTVHNIIWLPVFKLPKTEKESNG